MSTPKFHMDKHPKSHIAKGQISLCERTYAWITDDPSKVTCKQCLKVMADCEKRRRQAEAAREGCGCDGWKNNIQKISGPMVLHALRNGTKGYDGEKFKYCPWCAKKLPELEE